VFTERLTHTLSGESFAVTFCQSSLVPFVFRQKREIGGWSGVGGREGGCRGSSGGVSRKVRLDPFFLWGLFHFLIFSRSSLTEPRENRRYSYLKWFILFSKGLLATSG